LGTFDIRSAFWAFQPTAAALRSAGNEAQMPVPLFYY
jgi:hypothetical protein